MEIFKRRKLVGIGGEKKARKHKLPLRDQKFLEKLGREMVGK